MTYPLHKIKPFDWNLILSRLSCSRYYDGEWEEDRGDDGQPQSNGKVLDATGLGDEHHQPRASRQSDHERSAGADAVVRAERTPSQAGLDHQLRHRVRATRLHAGHLSLCRDLTSARVLCVPNLVLSRPLLNIICLHYLSWNLCISSVATKLGRWTYHDWTISYDGFQNKILSVIHETSKIWLQKIHNRTLN